MNEIARTIAGDVYEQLRNEIIGCRMPPGSKINIHSLMQRFNVNLGAVREALSKLSAEGIVIAMPQRGYMVSEVSAKDLTELTEARIIVESECLRQAIALGNLDWSTNIVAANHRLSNTPYRLSEDPALLDERWAKAHREYHLALVAACDNRWLLRVRDGLYDQSERYRQLSVPLSKTVRDVVGEHTRLAEAVLAKDADRACTLLAEHLWTTTNILTAALQK